MAANKAVEEKDPRGPSPVQPPVPPPSRTGLNYTSLEPTPLRDRSHYFPATSVQSSSPSSGSLPQSEDQQSGSSTAPVETDSGSRPSRIQRIEENTKSFDDNQKDVHAPGATENLRSKLAEHRQSMSAAYDLEHASRAKDYAYSASETPRLVRGSTFDQSISTGGRSEDPEPTLPESGRRQVLHKSHSITAPERHLPLSTSSSPPPIPAPLPSVPVPSTRKSPQAPTPVEVIVDSSMPNKTIRGAVVGTDPSTTKAPTHDGLPASRQELEEAVENPKKPFFKRAFGTRRKLLGGMPSQNGSLTSSSPFAPGTRPNMPKNMTGTASTTATRRTTGSAGLGFSLGGKQHKPSVARQGTKPGVPVGIAVPNTQRRREPTWSRKARDRPLYSLGKPLPTHEEVQAQRAWQQQMERIKELYPDAEPPPPPPLPSQQAASALAGGMQIDQAQLKNIIRSAIQEYKRYENGELDLDAVSTVSPYAGFGEASGARPRKSTARNSSVVSSSRRRAPSVTMGAQHFGLPRMDSAVIDEEDGPPLEPLPGDRRSTFGQTTRRKPSKVSSIGPGMPAGATQSQRISGNGKLEARRDTGSTSTARGSSKISEEHPAGIPAFAQEHEEEDEDEATTDSQRTNRDSFPGEEGGRSIEGSTILSRDHETQDNWSEEEGTELDPEEGSGLEGALAEDEEEEDDDDYPNFVARWRVYGREPFAEFLGAFVLSVIGIGASAQAALSADPNIQPTGTGAASTSVNLSAPLAWGAGVAMSVYIAGGISGGHISPAITIVLAVFRGFPWKRVPSYIAGQLLGFIAGSGVAYGLYRHAITIYEGGSGIRTLGVQGTASFFATYPMDYVSNANAFFQEFVNVALLLILILAIGDADNVPPPAGLNPIIIMFMVMAIGLSLGLQSAYCMNPARDLGPRLVSWWAGYGTQVWNFRDQYWLWCPWLADISGGLFGAFLYDTLIFMGRESPMNKRWRMPGILRSRTSDQKSHDWQGWRTRQKARKAGWRSRLPSSKETGSETAGKETV